ncbi:hypothetical protein NIES22_70590 (plasmid) [Calothrix brevissima NIES-22]|nr:hypothetical protein NIES22_70590 [Calothrix brevissima NIES-22]
MIYKEGFLKKSLKEVNGLKVQEVKALPAASLELEKYFDEYCLPIRLRCPSGDKKIPAYKRMILVYHPTDENQWFVSAAIAHPVALLTLGYKFTCVERKSRKYIPLPVLEDAVNDRFDNFRQIIRERVRLLAEAAAMVDTLRR